MDRAKIYFKKLEDKAKVPQYGTEYAAGADLYACMEEPLRIGAGRVCSYRPCHGDSGGTGGSGLRQKRSCLQKGTGACQQGWGDRFGLPGRDHGGAPQSFPGGYCGGQRGAHCPDCYHALYLCGI